MIKAKINVKTFHCNFLCSVKVASPRPYNYDSLLTASFPAYVTNTEMLLRALLLLLVYDTIILATVIYLFYLFIIGKLVVGIMIVTVALLMRYQHTA